MVALHNESIGLLAREPEKGANKNSNMKALAIYEAYPKEWMSGGFTGKDRGEYYLRLKMCQQEHRRQWREARLRYSDLESASLCSASRQQVLKDLTDGTGLMIQTVVVCNGLTPASPGQGWRWGSGLVCAAADCADLCFGVKDLKWKCHV